MRTFYRQPLLNRDFFGVDSTQGLLELARWYEGGKHVRFVMRESDQDDPSSLYSRLRRLRDEGYIEARWEPYGSDDSELKLKHVVLTTSGNRLLLELRERTARGRFMKRFGDVIWVICTSVVTTLLTLALKGGK